MMESAVPMMRAGLEQHLIDPGVWRFREDGPATDSRVEVHEDGSMRVTWFEEMKECVKSPVATAIISPGGNIGAQEFLLDELDWHLVGLEFECVLDDVFEQLNVDGTPFGILVNLEEGYSSEPFVQMDFVAMFIALLQNHGRLLDAKSAIAARPELN